MKSRYLRLVIPLLGSNKFFYPVQLKIIINKHLQNYLYKANNFLFIQMSNKNLKVYRIQFITEVKQMNFKVKFPCQVKMIWKRSNQSSQTTLVPVENGVVNFNQTLKMYVNMYFDTTTNRFVEKKCLFSFLIVTEKGEKSAGSFSYDLSQFFNKRIYEVDEQFALQKCPLPDTKIRMKIYYEQSTETGYDSMSRISTSSQLDISTTSMDLSQLSDNQHKPSSSNSMYDKKSEEDTASKGLSSQKDKQQTQSNIDLLNESDLGINAPVESSQSKSEKIHENIQALNKITGKINDFVSKCSGNIKTQIENLKHKNKMLQQTVSTSKFEIQKLNKEKQQQKTTIAGLKKQINELKLSRQTQQKKDKEAIEQLTHKYEQAQRLSSQFQRSLEQKGENQSSYIQQLKKTLEQRQQKLKQKVTALNQEISEHKKQKITTEQKLHKSQQVIRQLKTKLNESKQLNKTYENKEILRQKQLMELRQKLQDVYQNIRKAFGSVL